MVIVYGLLLLPLIEIGGFVALGPYLGVAGTLAVVAGSAALGLLLLRTEGFRMLAQMRTRLAEGRTPVPAAIDGVLRLTAALLLIVPGFFSDALALLLLLPPIRAWAGRTLLRRLSPAAAGFARQPPVIEGEFTEVDPAAMERERLRPPR